MAMQQGKLRLYIKRLFIFLNSVTALVFLLVALAPYLDPARWWALSILALGFVVVFVLLVFFLLFWLFTAPRYVFISLVPLLVGWQSLRNQFAFSLPEEFDYRKPAPILRVADWNVARFIELKRNNNKGSQTRLDMLALIKAQNADVLCFQEFFHSTDSTLYDNISYVQKKLGYPYYYYSWDPDGGLQWFGQIIFSRFPIVGAGKRTYPEPTQPESLIHADILFRGDTIRVYTTHLQSVRFKKQDYETIEEIKNRDDSLLQNSRNIFSKLKTALVMRSRQTAVLKTAIQQSPYPYILAGDFNDVPNSYTYFTLRKGLQDAFLAKGLGIGRTYSGLSPTLRIDYLLPTTDFTIVQFNRVVREYSDHYLLVADLELKKNTKGLHR